MADRKIIKSEKRQMNSGSLVTSEIISFLVGSRVIFWVDRGNICVRKLYGVDELLVRDLILQDFCSYYSLMV
jgi:hypothetical protein